MSLNMAESKSKTHPAFQSQAAPQTKSAAKAEPEVKTTKAAQSKAKAAPKRKTPAKSKATGRGAAKASPRTKAAAKPKAKKKTSVKAKPQKAVAPGVGTGAAEIQEAATLAPEVDDSPISLEWGRQKLDSELKRTREELEHLRAAMYSEVDIDPEEGDVEVSERLKNVTLIAMLEKRETALREALFSILEGSYGICNRCKKPIGKGRLEARPDAKFCVRCQEEIERAARRLA